jgi:dethiobiotin synthetase
MTYPRVLIAGTQSGVGKTTVMLALLPASHAPARCRHCERGVMLHDVTV